MKSIAKGFMLMMLLAVQQIYAEIIVDGSLGGGMREIPGNDYKITENYGLREGTNLFHSFLIFNVNTGESAEFSTNSATNNIFARVTGGESSLIDGTISIKDVKGSKANLWLMNPAGWFIGKGASINIQGAFHLTTADAIGFVDGKTYFADPTRKLELSAKAPIDYQFNQGVQATITLNQAELLTMPDHQDITLMGGDINMQNSSIHTKGGRVVLASNSGEGTWKIDETGVTQSSGEGGVISINHEPPSGISNPSISSSDRFSKTSSGGIQLTAEQIHLNKATILTQAWNDTDAGNTVLQADKINLTETTIRSGVLGSNNAGITEITGIDLTLDVFSKISSDTNIETDGLSGDIHIDLQGDLVISGESSISGILLGNSEHGGNIIVHANSVSINEVSALRLQTKSNANAGNITITANQLLMNNEGTLNSATSASGNGGNITVTVSNIKLTQEALISSQSAGSKGSGNAGNIIINANNLSLVNNSNIKAKSDTTGETGTITLKIKDFFELHSDSKITTSAVTTNGGIITVTSGTLVLDHSAIITSVEGLQGDGGNITVDTGSLVMNGGFIQANTAAVDATGGDIIVNADVTVASQGYISQPDERQQFSSDLLVSVIQAAAPDGVNGDVTIDTVELNLAEQLAKVDSNFALRQYISSDPCTVDRNEKTSSLVQKGQGGLPVKASDSINLPLQRYLPEDKLKPQTKLPPTTEKVTALSISSPCKK